MRLVVGLGNPEEKYRNNRHNAGHMLVDFLDKCELSADFKVKKTDVFMNESGIAVKKLVDFHKVQPDDLYVAYDDLDIPLGSYKIVKGKGPRQHNGVESVEQSLGTDSFWHIRIGVDSRIGGENRVPGKEYVLQNFNDEEKKILKQAMQKICQDLNNR